MIEHNTSRSIEILILVINVNKMKPDETKFFYGFYYISSIAA